MTNEIVPPAALADPRSFSPLTASAWLRIHALPMLGAAALASALTALILFTAQSGAFATASLQRALLGKWVQAGPMPAGLSPGDDWIEFHGDGTLTWTSALSHVNGMQRTKESSRQLHRFEVRTPNFLILNPGSNERLIRFHLSSDELVLILASGETGIYRRVPQVP